MDSPVPAYLSLLKPTTDRGGEACWFFPSLTLVKGREGEKSEGRGKRGVKEGGKGKRGERGKQREKRGRKEKKREKRGKTG